MANRTGRLGVLTATLAIALSVVGLAMAEKTFVSYSLPRGYSYPTAPFVYQQECGPESTWWGFHMNNEIFIESWGNDMYIDYIQLDDGWENYSNSSLVFGATYVVDNYGHTDTYYNWVGNSFTYGPYTIWPYHFVEYDSGHNPYIVQYFGELDLTKPDEFSILSSCSLSANHVLVGP